VVFEVQFSGQMLLKVVEAKVFSVWDSTMVGFVSFGSSQLLIRRSSLEFETSEEFEPSPQLIRRSLLAFGTSEEFEP